MKQDTEKTTVHFRVFRAGVKLSDGTRHSVGAVIAILPEHEGARADDCGSYMHIGQHSDCNPLMLRTVTKPATPEEYAPLARELRCIGYNLRIVSRIQRSYYWWSK